jgi:hypothetical protein
MALAVATKILLAVCVGIAVTQYTWSIVRSRPLTLGAIDTMFGATSDPLSIFNLELWRSAAPAILLSALIWSGVTPALSTVPFGYLFYT